MSVLTRIKNNQIVDSTIVASQKIQAGSITGSLFSSNVTVPGDLLISGNLFVLGTSAYTTIASTNTYVNDPLVVLNNGFAGTNTYDEGVVFNRGSLLNQAFIWSEFNKEFRLIGTTETGTAYGNVAVSNFANLHIGNLTVDYATSIGSLTTTGFINTSGNISGATGLFGAINSTGLINTTGNVSASQVSVATLNATGLINTLGNISASQGSFATVNATGLINTLGNISAATVNAATVNASGNVLATVFNGGSLNVSGNVLASIVLAQLVTADDATFGNVDAGFIGNTGTAFTGASINLSGNVLASSILTNFLTADDVVFGNVSAAVIGNAGATVTGTTAAFSGNVIGGLAQFAAINSTSIGNATASTGAFTTLSASQNFYANASIATTAQGEGAIVVPNGGISVSGAANIAGAITTAGAAQFNNTLTVGGITQVTNTTNATDATGATGALQVAGGASIAKDLWVGGNLYAANIIGVTANVITVQDPLLFLAPDHTFPYDYDIGIYSSFTGTGLTTAGNVLQHTGVVRHNDTNTWVFASNLAAPGAGHLVLDVNTVYDPIKAGNLSLVNGDPATNVTSGALQVLGGAGITGRLYVGSGIQGTVIGNVTAAAGFFTNINATGNLLASTVLAQLVTSDDATFGNVDAKFIGNTGTVFTGESINLSGNVSAAELNIGTIKATGLINTTANISAAVVNSGAINSTGLINTTGNVSAATVIAGQFNTTGNLVAAEVSTGTLNATGLINTTGNVSAATVIAGQFNTTGNLVAAQVSTGTLNATGLINTLGNISASRINADTLAATGTIWANAATDTSSLSTGALIVAGGTAVGKTLWVGEGAVINSTRAAEAFQVYGATGNNGLIYADTAKNAIVFSSAGNVTVQDGAIAKFDSAGAIVLPVGSNAQRPGAAGNVDVQGMIRFNSTSNNLEFYDGTSWTVAGSEFTIIATNSFSGNGVQTVFTLSASATTASTLVMVNGVVQIPTTAYSVSGTTLTFTEAPAVGDAIDARTLITTTTVSAISSGNGFNNFDVATAPYANITAGTSAATVRVSVDGGDGSFNLVNGTPIVYTQTAVNIAANNTPYVIATRSQTTFTSGKFIVTAKRGTGATGNVETYEAQVVTDGDGNAYITTYGVVNNGYTMGGLTANVLAGNVQVYYTGSIASAVVQANVKCFGTYII